MNFLPTLNGLFKNKLIVGIFRLLKVEKWHTEPRAPPASSDGVLWPVSRRIPPRRRTALKQAQHLSFAAVPTQETPPSHCMALGLQAGAFPRGLIPLMSLPVATRATALP